MQAMSSLQHVLNIDHDRLRIVMPHLKSLIKKQGLNPNWQKAGQLSIYKCGRGCYLPLLELLLNNCSGWSEGRGS